MTDDGKLPTNPGSLQRRVHRCGAMEVLRRRAGVDPEYRRRRRNIEQEVSGWLERAGRAGGRPSIVTIPVVVHIVWERSEENISDAQVQSQIDVLNVDFRRLNDISDVPAEFASLADDSLIQFALASRDPRCEPTTGITRTETTVDTWPDFSAAMKYSATNGIDAWPTDKYLNIWVISNTGGSYLGWGEFPGAPAAEDGVVIRHGAFGTVGTAGTIDPVYTGGRTATHEIGHWLNLIHIWGDDSGCGDSDNVADTPNQDSAYGRCPTHPQNSCGSNDMFMNFMDYVDDACMRIFSVGQVDRMHATLAMARAGILSSDGHVPPPPGSTGVADLWMRDGGDDDGSEPNPSAEPVWLSPDVWVRRRDDGIDTQEHQNPLYRPPSGDPNFVYVRVRNRACSATQTGALKLYWAKASSALSWPQPWDGSITAPALMGGFIGEQSVTVAGRETEIVRFSWRPPNPADYASFGADRAHFCLLARIETEATTPFGMTSPETSDLGANVRNNNNIAWKNVTISEPEVGGGRMESMLIASPHKVDSLARLVFGVPERMGLLSAFEWSWVLVRLSPELRKKWEEIDAPSGDVRQTFDDWLHVEGPGGYIDRLPLEAKRFYTVDVHFVPKYPRPRLSGRYALHVSHYEDLQLIGGVTFEAQIAADVPETQQPQLPKTFDGVSWRPAPCPSGLGDRFLQCCR